MDLMGQEEETAEVVGNPGKNMDEAVKRARV